MPWIGSVAQYGLEISQAKSCKNHTQYLACENGTQAANINHFINILYKFIYIKICCKYRAENIIIISEYREGSVTIFTL